MLLKKSIDLGQQTRIGRAARLHLERGHDFDGAPVRNKTANADCHNFVRSVERKHQIAIG